MSDSSTFPPPPPGLLARNDFQVFLEALKKEGYVVHAPLVSDGTVTWGPIDRIDDLPRGWQDHQSPGKYDLIQTASERWFDIVHGHDSLKRYTFAPREPLLTIERKHGRLFPQPVSPSPPKTAFLGVRACDLAGLQRQERIFLKDQFPDPYYQARRESLFLIAVNCTRALETCFCASMGTGPKAEILYDLALTESDADFVLEAGSPAGEAIMRRLPLTPVSESRSRKEAQRFIACAESQTRSLETSSLPQALYDAHDHPQWDEVAARCLACTNCTMVCPTCFCHTVEDSMTLSQEPDEHVRLWDSCFTENHGYIHGKNIRPTITDRYRMWLTHKLAAWIDQFGASGCVGCGRCITWCPVGIDLTQELPKLLGADTPSET